MGRSRLFGIGVLCALAACDSAEPTISNVTGDWTISWSLSGNGPSCVLTAPMTLTQGAGAFSGTFGPGTMVCNGTDSTTVGGDVTSGVVAGDSVAFDIDSPSLTLHQVGIMATATTMSGTSAGGGGAYVFAGPWTAHR